MKKGAIISECGKYRYQLWRIWNETKPLIMFVMHNPSTADADSDDPTIRRLIGFAQHWGYGGFYVGNQFPYRATNPKDLKGLSVSELCPLDNIKHINEMSDKCHLHVLAYGNLFDQKWKPETFDSRWHHLGLTKAGNPKHPLYLPKDAILHKMEP